MNWDLDKMEDATMKRLLALCLTLALVLGALPMHEAQAADLTMTVKGGWLRLRESASFNGDTISSYYTGTKVTVLGTNGAWYYVRTPDGRTGFMYGSYLTSAGTGSSGAVTQGVTAYVTSGNGKGVRLRSGPGKAYGVVTQAEVGTRVTILSSGTYWHYIEVAGKRGYMMAEYLTTKTPAAPAPQPDPKPDAGANYTAYVTSENGKGVRLRKGPSTAYGSYGTYDVGTQVTVHGTANGWSSITVGGQSGYMMTKFLTTIKPGSGSSSGSTDSGDVVDYIAYVTSQNGKGVKLRKGPSTAYGTYTTCDVGTKVTVMAKSGEWSYIDIGGQKGYMMSKFLTDQVPGSGSTGGSSSGSYTAYVTSENGGGVFLRKGMGKGYASLGIYAVGTEVKVLYADKGWSQVQIGSRKGYMMNQFLTTVKPGSNVVTTVTLSDHYPIVGDTLFANVYPVGANVTYEWITDNNILLATTASYKVTEDDLNRGVRVRVTGAGSYTGNATSGYAHAQKPGTGGDQPAEKAIEGTVKLNFTALMPGVTLTPTVSVNCASITYQWFADNVACGTGTSLQITPDMAGKEIKLVVKPAAGSGYTGQVESGVCTVLGSAPVATPTDL